MRLAIFDLDNTLIAGDSDYSWGQFIVEEGLVERGEYAKLNDYYYQAYKEGSLDLDTYHGYLTMVCSHLRDVPMDRLLQWRDKFIANKIAPLRLPKAEQLIDSHRSRGDELLIITATLNFITAPIVHQLGIDNLIASEEEIIGNKFTGEIKGVASYQEGKVTRYHEWLDARQMHVSCSYFYSDSHNDLPLLRAVDNAIAVDPDEQLRQVAIDSNWEIISLRS